MIKRSRQRDAILECLKNRYDHPTADEIYQSVHEVIPNISLGTVYRNLTFLLEQGYIIRLSTGLGPDHYDAITEPHYHFTCNQCEQVTDIVSPVMNKTNIEKINQNFDGEITDFKLMFYGICKKCKDNKKLSL